MPILQMLAKFKLSQLCHARLGRFYTSKNLVCEASEVRKEEGGMGNSLELSHSTRLLRCPLPLA